MLHRYPDTIPLINRIALFFSSQLIVLLPNILTLIKDCEDEPISKIEEEIEIIKEKTDGSLDLEKLDDLTTDQIEMLNEITNDNLELDDGFELEFKNKRLF